MNRLYLLTRVCALLVLTADVASAQNGGREHIKDNSFLIEEAYNQEKGVAQHIFNWYPTWDHSADGDLDEFTFLYTIELPVGGETHQFSFTPMVFEHFFEDPNGGPVVEEGGWGDVFLNYRYQLLTDDPCSMQPAVAPRFSVILPTGDEDRGLGTGEVGYQFNLPISKELDRFAFHFNAGTTVTPNVDDNTLNGYNLGGSIIWLKSYDVNFMLECVTNWDEELDDAGEIDDTTSVVLNPGIRAALFTGEEVQWVVGAGLPIGLSEDAPDIGVFIYMSVEHAFRTDHD
ncbi:MAG: hypothetical protein WD669_02320 [Pirellulales bacterium]